MPACPAPLRRSCKVISQAQAPADAKPQQVNIGLAGRPEQKAQRSANQTCNIQPQKTPAMPGWVERPTWPWHPAAGHLPGRSSSLLLFSCFPGIFLSPPLKPVGRLGFLPEDKEKVFLEELRKIAFFH